MTPLLLTNYRMDYSCKNSKKSTAISLHLGDLAMRVKRQGLEEVIHPYSTFQSVLITRTIGAYTVEITTTDGHRYSISNRYVHDNGQAEDKSNAYALFVRVLHMHLREKSGAHFAYLKKFTMPDPQKFFWVPLVFGVPYFMDRLKLTPFHWALQGLALCAFGILWMVVAGSNQQIKKGISNEIPVDILPN